MIRVCLLLLAALLPAAAPAALPELSATVARYKVIVNGIPAGTAATIAVQTGDGKAGAAQSIEASFNVQNRFFKHHEVSRFDWQGCRVTPHEYLHEFQGLGIERSSAISFDHAHGIAVETRGGKRVEIPLTANVTDGLNMAMLARCRLRDGNQRFNLPVIYRGERKELEFAVKGNERVETPAGTFDSVVVERHYPNGGRRTRVWVAPALDWFMVRFEHVENPVARGSMLLTDITLDGQRPAAVAARLHAADRKAKP